MRSEACAVPDTARSTTNRKDRANGPDIGRRMYGLFRKMFQPDSGIRARGGGRPPLHRSLLSLKPRRAFVSHGETFFQGNAYAADCAFVKQAADQGYAMRDTARAGESWDWIVGVGRPVAAGFLYLDESGTQRQRRVSGEVGDGEHLVAQ